MAYFNIGNFTANIANKGYAKSNKFEAEYRLKRKIYETLLGDHCGSYSLTLLL